MKKWMITLWTIFMFIGVLGIVSAQEYEVKRIFGSTRYNTSFGIANQLKETLNIERFDSVIIASGTNFVDALAGSVLAAAKNAPILMYNSGRDNSQEIRNYLEINMNPDGIVYVLGGTGAVSDALETGLSGYRIERLFGKTRYETNLAILEESGVTDEDILVCSSKNFADSLSASATGNPILLVGDALTDGQRDFLKTLNGNRIYVIGGSAAVNIQIEEELRSYSQTVTRLGGKTRYDTSVMIAETFFENPDSAVLAYARNYPDGLCGGPLAYALNAPLILVDSINENNDDAAAVYAQKNSIHQGAVLGGNILITDATVENIFGGSPVSVRYEKEILVSDIDVALLENLSVQGNVNETKMKIIDYIQNQKGFINSPVIKIVSSDQLAGSIVSTGDFVSGVYKESTVFTIQLSKGPN